ncbi:MAG: polysaccharide lyase family 1 protein [Rhodopirellula sp. JB055]|uniref:pectate lyase family protein n=1 Tax=Rhodopirellula sp. JB055 TaxID=3342846 RepID=UPI00370A2AB1
MNRSYFFVVAILGMQCLAVSSSLGDDRLNVHGGDRDGTSLVDVDSRLPAFPDARGWGRYATGGRGGEVRKVTHLKDSGPGSLRAALQTEGAAYVIFEVAGTINLQSKIKITSNKTIAGETAFRSGGEGITLKINQGTTSNTLVAVSGGSNLICRYLRFRRGPGLPPEVDGDNLLLTGKGTDFIFDHCSFSWSTDELVNPYGPTRITFQNCIFSEALFNSTHAYTTDTEHAAYPNPHSMGPLIGNGSDEVTFYNNLFTHNNQRNPLVGGGVGGGTKFELVNNLVYNFGSFGTVFSDNDTAVTVNFINNYHIAGPNTSTSRYSIAINRGVMAYARGNINSKRTSKSEPEWNAIGCESGCGTYMEEPAPIEWQSAEPFDFPLRDVSTQSATEIRDGVIANAGANLVIDAVDSRVFKDVLNGTGRFVNDPSEVGGWPKLVGMQSAPVDNDKDGMPDLWERERFGALATGPNADRDGDGYTNLEEYLHHLAAGNGLNAGDSQ